MTRALRRLGNDDAGFAMLTVVASMFVLTILATAALGYAVQTQSFARRGQDWAGALTAAQAGVDDYSSYLNRNDVYWQTRDCTNEAMRLSPPCPLPSGVTTSVGWQRVPGSADARFHYDATTTETSTFGTISLQSTGRVNGVERTVTVSLRRGGFGEFLYYTDYETIDPANEAVFGHNNTGAAKICARHYWDDPARPSDPGYWDDPPTNKHRCWDISFTTGDNMNGPMHSNDAIVMSGTPHFMGTVTTAWPKCQPVNGVSPPTKTCYRVLKGETASPTFDKGISYRDKLDLPPSIDTLRPYVDPAQTKTPGCLYTGPTRIKFLNSGQMEVYSNFSKQPLNPGCGNSSAAWPQTVSVPASNVILVQPVPAEQITPPAGAACQPGSIGDNLPQQDDLNLTYPEADCRAGTAYIEGVLKGRVTLSTDNNVVITGDLTYAGGKNGTDTLGLIAKNSVEIYHPYSSSSGDMARPIGTTFREPTIQAAILTLQHSFAVQSYDKGKMLGSINFFGSISQKYRGAVGTINSSGYLKKYEYDTRLKYAPPPYFLDPVRSSWGVKTFGEDQVPTAYR